MYSVHDWAEVQRLHRVEGMSKAAIAAKLAMSRTTVHRLVSLPEPPRYVRSPAGSKLDALVDAIAAMLDDDPRMPATVMAQRLRPLGFTGSLTILKDHLRRVRPQFLAASPISARAICLVSWGRRTGGTPGSWCPSARARSARRSAS